MTLTPERRQEIEAMLKQHDETDGWHGGFVDLTCCEASRIIPELLAEIDRLNEQRDAFRQLWRWERSTDDELLEEPVRHPHE